jgi:hypothetical protein
MPKSLFNSLKGCKQLLSISAAPKPLTLEEVEQVSGGRMKIPGGHPPTVFYDDGITLVTSDPTLNTL